MNLLFRYNIDAETELIVSMVVSCPNDCGKHGECRSMRLNAQRKDKGLPPSVIYDSVWDSDMVHGCVCEGGYGGGDCSQRRNHGISDLWCVYCCSQLCNYLNRSLCNWGRPAHGSLYRLAVWLPKNEKQTVYCAATVHDRLSFYCFFVLCCFLTLTFFIVELCRAVH